MSLYPFGACLGRVSIDGAAVDVFSNGACAHVSAEKTFDETGDYLGIRFQCVEFVRRYIRLRHRRNLAMLWQDGDACDWFDNREKMGLEAVPAADARVGDIITFTGGKWGHVAIVMESRPGSGLYICQQNFMNAPEDLRFHLEGRVLSGEKAITDAAGALYRVQSVLRLA